MATKIAVDRDRAAECFFFHFLSFFFFTREIEFEGCRSLSEDRGTDRVADGVEEDVGRVGNREKGRIVGEAWLGRAKGWFMDVRLP